MTAYWMELEAWTRKRNSLLCFSLMLPWGSERKLLKLQLAEHKSIFACDESSVYSHSKLDLGGYMTKALDVDLHSQVGGRFHTVLNTRIFIKVWDRVFRDGRF